MKDKRVFCAFDQAMTHGHPPQGHMQDKPKASKWIRSLFEFTEAWAQTLSVIKCPFDRFRCEREGVLNDLKYAKAVDLEDIGTGN